MTMISKLHLIKKQFSYSDRGNIQKFDFIILPSSQFFRLIKIFNIQKNK